MDRDTDIDALNKLYKNKVYITHRHRKQTYGYQREKWGEG